MKKILPILIGLLLASPVFAISTFQVVQGGTGASTLTGCLTGNGTSAITGSGTCSTYPWPFTKQSSGSQATSTLMEWIGGFMSDASSTLTRFTAGNSTTTGGTVSGDIGGVYLNAAGSGVGGIGFNSTPDGSYNAGVSGYGALFQLAPSTGVFSMFTESNVSAGVPHGHITSLSWDATGLVSTPVGLVTKTLLANGSTTLQTLGATNASTTLFSSQYASSTIICFGGDTCRTTWPTSGSSFAWPFTKQAGGEQSTSTELGLYNGFLSLASSTINSSLLVAGSTTLQLFTATQGTITSATSTNDYSTHYLALGTSTLQNITAQASVFANATGTNSLATVANFITVGAAATPAYVASTTNVGPGNIASSSVRNGNSFNRASTTITFAPWFENRQVVGASCMASSTAANPGGVNFQVGNKTNWTSALFCDANPRTYTFTAIQIAAFSNFLSLTVNAASSTPDSVSINIITQKVGP